MKRLFSFLALVIITPLCGGMMSGCSLFQHPDKVLANGIDDGTKEVFAEYEKYVIEGKPRPAFTASDAEIRRESIRRVKALLDQARK